MKMRGLTESGAKFAKRGAAAGAEYRLGVQNPDRPWQEATLAGKENYETEVMAAIARGAFESGVSKTSNADWLTGAAGKGARNYPAAVGEAGPKWIKGYGPTHSALGGLTLPPRGPRNSPGNYERSRLAGDTASKARTGS